MATTRARRVACALAALAALAACSERGPEPAAVPPSEPAPLAATSQEPTPSVTATPPSPRTPRAPRKPRAARPNILLLLTDDQAFTDMDAMPRTRARLRRLGTEFTRAYSTYPLCCPARVTLMTGQEAHNHGVMGNELPWGGFHRYEDRDSLPVWLDDVGYETIVLGKYLQEYPDAADPTYVPPGWDQWNVTTGGAYDYYDFLVNENGTLRRYSDTYQTSYLTGRTIELLTRSARAKRPFFLWANYLAPHIGAPLEADDPRARFGPEAIDTPAVEGRYRDALAGTKAPRTPNLNEARVRDKGYLVRRRSPLPLDQVDEAHQQRRESLMSVDDSVMRILDALERTGELEQTLIVFASDNGHSGGAHRWWGKVLGYEESTHVPLFVAGPGFERGVRRDQLVTLTDVGTTMAAAARTDPTVVQDGLPLQPFSADPRHRADRSILFEAGGWPMPKADRLYHGVRTADDLVLLRWWNGFEEVYDLARDPYQLDGTVDSRERTRLRELRAKLERLAACRGGACTAQ